jgi:hypothetical protein
VGSGYGVGDAGCGEVEECFLGPPVGGYEEEDGLGRGWRRGEERLGFWSVFGLANRVDLRGVVDTSV